MLEQNPILRPQQFFQSRIELEFPTTQIAMKLQRDLYLVGTSLYMTFKRKLFSLWSMSVFPRLIHKGDIVLNKDTTHGYFWICTFLTLLNLNDSLAMSWDNLKTVQALTEETLWQEDRKMHCFFFFWGACFLFYRLTSKSWGRILCLPECHNWLQITHICTYMLKCIYDFFFYIIMYIMFFF